MQKLARAGGVAGAYETKRASVAVLLASLGAALEAHHQRHEERPHDASLLGEMANVEAALGRVLGDLQASERWSAGAYSSGRFAVGGRQ